MFIFTPLNDGKAIADVRLTADELHELRDTLQMALDYNPSSAKFAEAMEPARKSLGDAWIEWITALQKIKTTGEREGIIYFCLEDWISSWRIADFIDLVWTVAKVRDETDSPSRDEPTPTVSETTDTVS